MNHQNTPAIPVTTIFQKSLRGLLGLALGALALGSAGCVARAYTGAAVVYEEPTVEVATVPAEIEYYPRHEYNGTAVYLVEGRWYHHSHDRWVVYRAEPRALASVRVSYEAKYGRNYRPRPEHRSPRAKPHHH